MYILVYSMFEGSGMVVKVWGHYLGVNGNSDSNNGNNDNNDK